MRSASVQKPALMTLLRNRIPLHPVSLPPVSGRLVLPRASSRGHAHDADHARCASDELHFRYASMHSATMRHPSLCDIQLSPSTSRQLPSAIPTATHSTSSRELPTPNCHS